MITRSEDLQALCERASRARTFALDTEFQRERRYSPELQLVQVAIPGEVVLIDPLEINDLGPLWSLVADPTVEVLLHDATQDLEIFFRSSGLTPRRIIDTQVAAAMVGLGEQPGYAAVCEHFLGVKLSKKERVTDWGRRPLSPRQEAYALDDVRYLHPLYEKLSAELRRLGRTRWFQAELTALEDTSRFDPDPMTLWSRVAGQGNLHGQMLAILQELAAWRERAAQDGNLPRRHVLPDDVLIDLCRRAPTTEADLGDLRRLTRGHITRYGAELLAAVERGRTRPPDQWPRRERSLPSSDDHTGLVELLALYVRLRARHLSIAANYLATSSDLKAFVAHLIEPQEELPAVLCGWRRRFIGDEMLEIAAGKLSVGFNPRRGDLALYEEP